MKINMGNIEYDVKWERWWISSKYSQQARYPEHVEEMAHPLPFEQISTLKDKLMVTKCVIREVDNSKQGKEKYVPVSSGFAVQSPHDNPNKFIGRKCSLTKALRFSDKEVRKQVWKVFAQEQMKTNVNV